MRKNVQTRNNSRETICNQVHAERGVQPLRVFWVILLMSLTVAGGWPNASAESGTWILNPVDNDWNNPANWSSNTVPDIAFFAASNIVDISITANNGVDQMTFNPGATAYSITALPGDSLSIRITPRQLPKC